MKSIGVHLFHSSWKICQLQVFFLLKHEPHEWLMVLVYDELLIDYVIAMNGNPAS